MHIGCFYLSIWIGKKKEKLLQNWNVAKIHDIDWIQTYIENTDEQTWAHQ